MAKTFPMTQAEFRRRARNGTQPRQRWDVDTFKVWPTVGRMVTEVLARTRLTQKQLGEYVGVAQSNISMIRRSNSRPPYPMVIKYRQILAIFMAQVRLDTGGGHVFCKHSHGLEPTAFGFHVTQCEQCLAHVYRVAGYASDPLLPRGTWAKHVSGKAPASRAKTKDPQRENP